MSYQVLRDGSLIATTSSTSSATPTKAGSYHLRGPSYRRERQRQPRLKRCRIYGHFEAAPLVKPARSDPMRALIAEETTGRRRERRSEPVPVMTGGLGAVADPELVEDVAYVTAHRPG